MSKDKNYSLLLVFKNLKIMIDVMNLLTYKLVPD